MANDWFEIRKIRPGLWMIVEPLHVVSWLIEGAERAALIDSGTGIVPLGPIVGQLTARPVTVINTHYHFDHIGCNAAYDTRLASVRAAPLLARPSARDLLARYVRELSGPLAMVQARLALDPDSFALAPETRLRPMPPGFSLPGWQPGSVPPTATLTEGDAVELGGGTQLLVIDTPGHSPDGICLFDSASGTLFAGDTLNEGSLYAHYRESSVEDLLVSLAKLARLGEAVRCICAGHVARAIAETSLIDEVMAAATAARDGRVPARDTVDVFGYPIREVRVGRVWITLPHPDGPAFELAD